MSLEKLAYDLKYTAGSYADLIMSVPILLGKGVAKASEAVGNRFGYKNPEFLSWGNIERKSEVIHARDTLRNKLDARPGNLFITSNLVSLIPFYLAGYPVAEYAADVLRNNFPESSELVKCVTNSASTILGQFAAGYTTYMASEVALNRQKYVDGRGRLSPKKIGAEFLNAAKAFLLVFDGPCAVAKLGVQSWMIAEGKDPGIASQVFDQMAIPAYFAACVPMGLHKRMIITNKSDKLFPERPAENSAPAGQGIVS